MTRRTKEPPKDSIRAKLGEAGTVWTIQQMRAMTIEALDEIAASGITHVRRGNLYVNPVDAKGNAVTRIGRHKLQDIAIAAPYSSAAEKYGL